MFTLTIVLLLGLGNPPSGKNFNNLGKDHYQARETAQKDLARKMDLDLYLQLKRATFTSLEAKRRAEAVMADYEGRIDFKTYQQVIGMKEFIRLEENYKQRMLAKWMVAPKNYPAYPWLYSLPRGYQWNGWGGWKIENFYLNEAQKMRGLGYPPFWNDYRLATQMWVFIRIEQGIGHASNGTEKEFNASMEKLTVEIRRDLHYLIQQEDAWWEGQRTKNPLRFLQQNKQWNRQR